MNCKNCGHDLEKHIVEGKRGDRCCCIDNDVNYPFLSCGCSNPEPAGGGAE